MKRDSFIFRRNFYEPVKNISNEDKGILFDAVCNYALNNIVPGDLSSTLQMAFSFISSTIDWDLSKYQTVIERNRQNGKKGGRPTKNPEEPKKPSGLIDNPKNPEEPKKPKKAYIDIDTDIERGEVEEVFTPPTLPEVIEFFLSYGSDQQTAKKAFDHYDIASWKKANNKPVGNWQQAMLTTWINGSIKNHSPATGSNYEPGTEKAI